MGRPCKCSLVLLSGSYSCCRYMTSRSQKAVPLWACCQLQCFRAAAVMHSPAAGIAAGPGRVQLLVGQPHTATSDGPLCTLHWQAAAATCLSGLKVPTSLLTSLRLLQFRTLS